MLRMNERLGLTICALCEREVKMLTYHHLVPKQKGGKHTETVPLCQPCHTTLHITFTNAQLATVYNNIPALQQAAALQKYLHWIKNKSLERISNRRKKGK